tara:strand:- start:719 stop:1039 length:321 start_codon:yes stop_codon:yes gene_type:complete
MKNNIFFYSIIFFLTNLIAIPTKSDPIFDLGKDIFLNKAVCSTCHTLIDAGSNAQIGPNLNEIKPDKNRVIISVTNGIGVMPAYDGQLSLEEIEAVSHYVSIAATK